MPGPSDGTLGRLGDPVRPCGDARSAIASGVVGKFLRQTGVTARASDDGPVPSLSSGELRRLWMDLLCRPPFPEEREAWRSATRPEAVDHLLTLQEFWQNWLEEQLYFFLLIDNHRPTTDSIQSIPAEMASGRLTVLEALHRVCISSSFDRRNPGPDTFVSVVMEQILGLTVQDVPRELETGKRLYDGRSGRFLGQGGNSQADVVRIAIEDDRAAPHFLRREYQRLLREEPGRSDLTRWARALEDRTRDLASILREWLVSSAYDRRLEGRLPQPNRLFVRSLFVDLLGRLPGEDETQRIRNALDGLTDAGPLRALVARILLDSGKARLPDRAKLDPEGWVDELFSRLLGREPTSREQRAFLESLAEPECRLETVVYAIVSHPEYQTW